MCKVLATTIFFFLFLVATHLAHATHSADIGPLAQATPHVYKAYVNTERCTNPIYSMPYGFFAGNGVGAMEVTCPTDFPVMFQWNQYVGFVGAGSVQVGGGVSSIKCCAMDHQWVPISGKEVVTRL